MRTLEYTETTDHLGDFTYLHIVSTRNEVFGIVGRIKHSAQACFPIRRTIGDAPKIASWLAYPGTRPAANRPVAPRAEEVVPQLARATGAAGL